MIGAIASQRQGATPFSFWRTPLADDTAPDTDSAAIVAALLAAINTDLPVWGANVYSGGPTLSAKTALYKVGADQPRVAVGYTGAAKGGLDTEMARGVPVPPGATVELPASDENMTVWKPSEDTLWDMHNMQDPGSGWTCTNAGVFYNASSSPGYSQTIASGAGSPQRYDWGVTATWMQRLGGLITKRDFDRVCIDHAMICALPNTNVGGVYPAGTWTAPYAADYGLIASGRYAHPAQNKDGHNSQAFAFPEGARLRIAAESEGGPNIASLDLGSAWAQSDTRWILANAFAKALQDYGMLCIDGTDGVRLYRASTISAETGWYPATAALQYEALMKVFGNATIQAALEIVEMDVCTNTAIPCPVGGQ